MSGNRVVHGEDKNKRLFLSYVHRSNTGQEEFYTFFKSEYDKNDNSWSVIHNTSPDAEEHYEYFPENLSGRDLAQLKAVLPLCNGVPRIQG